MDNLKIKPTKDTLGVDFQTDSGILSFFGKSYPENAFDFFDPIFNWLTQYLKETQIPIVLKLSIDYLNTSSLKCIIDMLEIFEQYYQAGGKIKVQWYYAEGDISTRETGEDFNDDYEIPFEILLK